MLNSQKHEFLTQRLRLRSPTPADAAMVAQLLSPAVSRWLAAWPQPLTEAVAGQKITAAQEEIEAGLALCYLMERQADHAIMGWFKVSRSEHNPGLGDLSYWLNECYHGHGYATEALLGLLPLAFEQLNLDEIEAGAQLENTASFAVMKKLGMKACGRRAVWAPTRNREEYCDFYSLSRANKPISLDPIHQG